MCAFRQGNIDLNPIPIVGSLMVMQQSKDYHVAVQGLAGMNLHKEEAVMRPVVWFLVSLLWLSSSVAQAQSDSQRAQLYIDSGVEYARQQNYQRAIEEFSHAIQIWPYNSVGSWAYYNRGYTYELLRNVTQAIADYNLALVANPNNERAKQRRHVLEAGNVQPHITTDPATELDNHISTDKRNVDIMNLPNGPLSNWLK
jgi:tetratricopeptide (TPR) repeat protein